MTDDPSSRNTNQRSWLERLSQALLREPKDREQLVNLLRDAEQRHLLDAEALSMIEGVLQVSEMQVRDIMIPRSQMVVVEIDANFQDILQPIIESAHSRFPVIGENRDEVLGFLLAKDLLSHISKQEEPEIDLQHLLRPAVIVPESKRLDVLLKEFRLKRNHMAMVVDEYGGVSGLVTIEDVLEQIVGDIEDEHDIEEDEFIKSKKDNLYTVNALTPIEDFNKYFNCDLDDEEFDTIGGLVMHSLGHLPECDETVDIEQYRFKVLHSDKRRIRLLEAEVLETSGS